MKNRKLKNQLIQKHSSRLYHLRTIDGKEIDLLIETDKGYYAIEIKMSVNVVSHDARHFAGLASILDKPLLNSFVLSNDPIVKRFGDHITAIPVQLFLT